MSRRVVISGVGALSAAGTEVEELRSALRAGDSLARTERIQLGDQEWFETSIARKAEIDPGAYLSPARRRRMSRFSQDWVIACLKARADAGLQKIPEPEASGVVMGSGLGSLDCTFQYLDRIRTEGMGLGSPFLFSESVANAPVGHATIDLDCRGLGITLTCGDASGLVAAGYAARAISDGRMSLALAGGMEELPDSALAVLARMGALPVSAGELRHRRMPRDLEARRIAPGEGVACFLLEEREQARRRGVIPYAEIRASALASDPEVGAGEWSPSPELRVEVMRKVLRESGLGARDLDGVILHACGDPGADRAEVLAVEQVIGEEGRGLADLEVTAPSRVLGRFAGAGAFSLAAAALSLRSGAPSDLSLPEKSPRTLRHFFVSGSSWGGGLTGLVLSRVD